jgi:ABC-type transporter Mla subunit MlaD
VIRRLPLLTVAAAAVLAGVLLYDAVLGNPGGRTWAAEFTNARGLLAGNDVRAGGAVVGRVVSIGLTRRGTALVSFQLSAPAAAPRADAAAAIEPSDLLGDTYMSLSPGSAQVQLRGAIDTARTVNAPRLDEVLNAFSPSVRDGLGVLLTERGLALDGRGGDLARSVVALRPGLSAASAVLSELNTQNGSLARLVPVAQQAAAQLDSRRGDIGPLLEGLASTVSATAGATAPLQQGLAGLRATLGRLRDTSGRLSATADAALPLVVQLRGATAPLASVLRGVRGLTQRITQDAPAFVGTLAGASSTLASGGAGLSRLAAAFPVLRAQAPNLGSLLSELDAAMPGIAQGFFVDFPDQAAESGRQPFDPFADPRRSYWRGAAVFSCEAFGVPVAPGCMSKALANVSSVPLPLARDRALAPATTGRSAQHSAPTAPTPPASTPTRPTPAAPASSSTNASNPAPAPPTPPNQNPITKLLGFLLGP